MGFISEMTPEQRANALAKAKAAREEKTRKYKENAHKLKQNFSDSNHWKKLASKYGVRMPSSWVPGSEYKVIRKAARKLSIEPSELRERLGGDVKFINANNPDWPAYAIIGLLLEIREDMDSVN